VPDKSDSRQAKVCGNRRVMGMPRWERCTDFKEIMSYVPLAHHISHHLPSIFLKIRLFSFLFLLQKFILGLGI
jgi:hypothetical protein